MQFNILGPLEAWSDGRRLELGGPIARRILAVLLLEPGKLLTVSRLVDAAWPDNPPTTASHQVRKAIADLRRRIPGGSDVLITDGPGYAIAAHTPLDATQFDAKAREAKALIQQGRTEEATVLLGAAIALRRGPALSGIGGGGIVESVARVMEERHLEVVEQYFELQLASGKSVELVGDLREHTSRHPLQETLRGLLMLALFRSGRRAEALTEYGRLREELAEELGVDPDPQLARLYEKILVESPELDGPARPAEVPAPRRPEPEPPRAPVPAPIPVARPAIPVDQGTEAEAASAPRTLPYDLADFVGRDKELGQLLATARRDEQRTRIIAIDGMGGTGKTSLAVRAAYLLADDYPDGQLYLDLRGFSPDERPVNISTALEVLLRTLGVNQDRIPDDLVGQKLLWQSVLAGRRVLLLLDNASADAALVSRLLPTTPGCLVLVTSRARLVELDGAEWISIDVLAPEESLQLVAQLLGPERVEAEPDAARELTHLCGYLPLALRIATARLRNRRAWSLQYLVERLRDENRKLDELNSGERGVATTLRLSYQVLPESCRRAFRSLSLHPGREFDAHSAAAVLAESVQDTEDHLEQLLDAHLLQQPEVGRYAYHDLVRSFARGLCDELAAADRAAAAERLLEYYLTASEAACEVLYPGRSRRPTGLELPPLRQPGLLKPEGAQTWFAKEHITLASVVHRAVTDGYHRHAVCLSRNVAFYLNAQGNLDEFAELTRIAVQSARHLGDAGLLSVSLANLGVACWQLGRYDEGIEVASESLQLAVRVGDRHTEAHSQGTLGLYKSLLGQFSEALGHLEQAVALERELDSPRAEADTLTALSTLYEQWGRYREAAEAAQRAVALVRGLDRHENALIAQTDLALALLGLGDLDGAGRCLAEARGLPVDRCEPGQMALTMALSAEVAYSAGDLEQAEGFADQARERVEQSLSPLRRAKVGNVLGRLLRSLGRHAEAQRLHGQAYKVAAAISFRIEEAYALAGLAATAVALGDSVAADVHHTAAEELFALLGVPTDRRRRPASQVTRQLPG
ncbi:MULTISPECIES: BTAD domain-containing putative transcriptional regulator [Streptacidiphilus]|uniref:BTAD domain-containing putative transcriptional regulator n=1 Tax=Streptacidiphilus cavernicola TaxID=3342716 RepID=A0ABV6UGY3_9ACTN